MDAIVAVYADWGIGREGTQPVTLKADRRFFRSTTAGAVVIVGRRTVEDFPGKQPLPGRRNLLLTRSGQAPEGFEAVSTVEEALDRVRGAEHAFVIGGGSVYRALLPYCRCCFVTKIGITPGSDTFFENLDQHPDWLAVECLQSGQEDGIAYECWRYENRACL